MKKVFIVTGEVSGDRLAAWYVTKRRQHDPHIIIQAIGGDFLQAAGVTLYERFEKLNIVGVAEIIRHLPAMIKRLYQLRKYLIEYKFDEIVLVDFPGFNLRLAKLLKAKNPLLKITYLSPPQVWCWGAWRIENLKKYTDQIVVLYPFEVAWYAQRGVKVLWLGSPAYDAMEAYMSAASVKQPLIALIPGSRHSEIITLLPLFLAAAARIKKIYPEIRFVLPLARSLSTPLLEQIVQQHHLEEIWQAVTVVTSEEEKFEHLARCCVALSKPGTVTLELALLGIPTLVVYKTSWVTYYIARLLVSVRYMSLPNLLLNKEIFKEIIQYQCSPEIIAHELKKMYEAWLHDGATYQKQQSALGQVSNLLRTPPT